MFQFLLTVFSVFLLRHDIFNDYNIAIQLTLQFGQYFVPLGARLIHFIYE